MGVNLPPVVTLPADGPRGFKMEDAARFANFAIPFISVQYALPHVPRFPVASKHRRAIKSYPTYATSAPVMADDEIARLYSYGDDFTTKQIITREKNPAYYTPATSGRGQDPPPRPRDEREGTEEPEADRLALKPYLRLSFSSRPKRGGAFVIGSNSKCDLVLDKLVGISD